MTKLKKIHCRNYTLHLQQTLIMGILNVTPDSFSDGGQFIDEEKAVIHAKKLMTDGADIIDIGGESTRPGSQSLTEEEELDRILPIIKKLVSDLSIPISIDTYKPLVAEECLKVGAHLINDITALKNPQMIDVVAKYNVPVVLMHMQGTPKIMQENPVYKDVVTEVMEFLRSRSSIAQNAGINEIIIDPGIGFGKTVEHNLKILKNLRKFTTLGYPILIGPSRKSFIGAITGLPVTERVEGTLAAVTIAVMNGAQIIRVHDVKECKRALQIIDAIRGS